MKFFLFISLFTAVMLGITVQSGRSKLIPPPKTVPAFMKRYHQMVKADFKKPETANILFSFFTGNKNGISPYTKKAFKKVNLTFLLSPSGIHLSACLLIIMFFVKKIKFKWVRNLAKAGVLSSLLFLPGLESIKRLSILRLLFQVKFHLKMKLSTETVFLLTFIISFIFGQYASSPVGFIFSFAFLGTFFSLQNQSKLLLILGLFSTQLILALFLGNKVSLLSIPLGLFGAFLFTFLFPLCLLFLMTYWFIGINWIEPVLRIYIVAIQWSSKAINGTFTSSSLFLIIAVWILMYHRDSLRKLLLLATLIFLHTNTAMTPLIFHQNLPTSLR